MPTLSRQSRGTKSLATGVRAALLLALAGSASSALAQPVGTAFMYQASLSQSGTPASGVHDMRFRLYDAAAGGAQVGPTLCVNDLTITGGLVAASLDFGSVFAGQMRYLEIEIRSDTGLGCGDASGFTVLTPRQALSAAPNAVFAATASSAATASTATTAITATSAANALSLGGTPAANYATLSGNHVFSGQISLANPANVMAGSFSGSGLGLIDLNASSISTGTLPEDAFANARATQLQALSTIGLNGSSFTFFDGAPELGTQLTAIVEGDSAGAQMRFTGVPSADFVDIGQSADGSFVVETNDQPWLTITPAGMVGVGPHIPQTPLDVRGGLNGSAFLFMDVAPSSGTQLITQFLSAENAPQVRFQNLIGGPFADIGQSSSGDFVVESGDIPQLVINAVSGNVGIGTTSPTERLSVAGNIGITGTATASSFSGSGASLTGLNAASLTTGTVPGARLDLAGVNGSGLTNLDASSISTGVIGNNRTSGTPNADPSTLVQRNASGNFSANAITAGAFIGSGAALTNLDASSITTGTIGNGRTTGTPNNNPSTLVQRNASGNFSANVITAASFAGSGATLTNLDASSIATGTIGNGRTTGTSSMSAETLVLRDASGSFSAGVVSAVSFFGSGSGLTTLNASNIAIGTLAAGRLPGIAARTDQANAFGNFTNSFAGNVGIGTATPTARLHVTGPNGSVFQFTDFPLSGGSQVVAQFMSGTGLGGPQVRFQRFGSGFFTDIGENMTGDFVIEQNDAPRLFVQSVTGSVGIGTTTPQARLEVAGGETILEQEAWQIPVMANAWANYGFGYETANYYKDSTGTVHLRGVVRDGTSGYIMTLPDGYRPFAARRIFMTWGFDGTERAFRVDVLPDGRVYVLGATIPDWLSLEGISFRP